MATRLVGILGRALVRPGLMVAMARAAWRFRARRWWRRPPFLPVPPSAYMAWRLHTAYGDGGRAPTVDEVQRYMTWANDMHGGRRRTGAE